MIHDLTCSEGKFTCFNWFKSRVSIREFTGLCGQIGCTDVY